MKYTVRTLNVLHSIPLPDIFTYCTIIVLPLTTVYFVNEVHCTSNILHSNTLPDILSLHVHTITVHVLPLTTMYFVNEVQYTLNILHSITLPDIIIIYIYYHCTSIDYSE